MKIYILLLLFVLFIPTLKSKEVVNDTLWTLQMETSNFGFTCSEGHNRFYTTNGYYINQDRFTYIASHSLDDGSELVRKEYGSRYLSIVYYKLEDKIIVNVQDSLFFLDPVSLDVINKVKLPSYTKNGLEISDYNCFLDNMDIFIVNKYLKISPNDKVTNRDDGSFIYDIENNEYIKGYNFETKNHFNSDESLFISGSTGGFDIYNTEDWSKIYTFRTEYKYFEDEFEYRYLDYIVEHIAFSPDGSRVALAIYKETDAERNRIEIFNLITQEFEESFQIENIEGVSKAKGRARIHFVDNETLILGRDNYGDLNPRLFLYKLNTNGKLIEFPQQNFALYNTLYKYISLENNAILCNSLNFYSKINVTPELLTNVEESSEQTLYPNPTTGLINIEFNSLNTENVNIEIVNELGEVMGNFQKQIFIGKNTLNYDITSYPKGIYFIRIKEQNITFKVLKE